MTSSGSRVAFVLAIAITGVLGAVAPGGAADKVGRVTEFSTGITAVGTEYGEPVDSAGLNGITAGPDGNLWFVEQYGDRIGRITPKGKVTEFSVGITPGSYLTGITAGPDGNLWFTEAGVSDVDAGGEGADAYPGRIGRITPKGKVTEFSAGITTRNECGPSESDSCFLQAPSPGAITAGPDGNLWFTERHAGRIGRITPDGVVTEFSAGISLVGQPPFPPSLGGITAGPDGNVWFASRNRIGRITPDGVVTEFSTGNNHFPRFVIPDDITAGPDGNLWFTEEDAPPPSPPTQAGGIGRITPTGEVTHFVIGKKAQTITAGPDGNLWFTERTGNRIGRITTDGVVTYVSAGITDTPKGVTAGCDGNVWFTEDIGSVGRIELDAPAKSGRGDRALPAACRRARR